MKKTKDRAWKREIKKKCQIILIYENTDGDGMGTHKKKSRENQCRSGDG